MPILSDELLSRLTRVPGLRVIAARRAAARALHAAALAAAPDDPVVLARLDLLAAAIAAPAPDRRARAARGFAAAAVGDAPADTVEGGEWRRRLARDLARRDPATAAALLDGDPLAVAACRLAAGQADAAAALVAGHTNPEALLIQAAALARCGDGAAARARINQLFAEFRLAGPLAASDEPPRLDNFAGTVVPVADGPLVSLIMPLLDGAATVEQAIGSLLAQSWRAIEIIVCDDGSRDDGPVRVAALARRDPRVRLLANHLARGAAGARNTGILAARGAYLAFLDADDWAHPERLERQVGLVDGRSAGTVSTHFRVDDGGVPVAPRVVPMIRLCPISMLVRADAIARVGPSTSSARAPTPRCSGASTPCSAVGRWCGISRR